MSNQALVPSPSPELISPDFDGDRAFSVSDWNAEISRIYRAARRGRIDAQRACRLVFVAGQGLKAAGQIEELQHLTSLQSQLTRLESGAATPPAQEH